MTKQEWIDFELVQPQKITAGTHLDSSKENLNIIRLLT